jgi:hypothetical protein
MNTPIQIICTDFDGTVFAEFEHQPIPECLVRLIQDLQSAGAKWVINTGRDLSSLMEALARSHIPIQPDYLVLVEREIHIHTGSAYRSHQEWNEACVRDHNHLYHQVRPEIPGLAAWITRQFTATIYEDIFSPLCLIAETVPEADAIHDFLNEFARQIPSLSVVRNDVYMRFCHSAYNKGTALTEIAELLQLKPEAVFAAGDHLNDLPMLRRQRAHWLAAPANAVPQVREQVHEQQGFLSGKPCGLGVAEGLHWCLKQAGH